MNKSFDMRHSPSKLVGKKKVSKGRMDIASNKKVEVNQGLNFNYRKERKSGKNSFKILFILILIALSSIVIYGWQKNSFKNNKKTESAIEKNEQKIENSNSIESVWDLKVSAEENVPQYKKILVASELDNHTIVYSEDMKEDNREVIFEFDRNQDSLVEGAKKMPIDVALSPDKKKIAFVADGGLTLYDLASKEKKLLIAKEERLTKDSEKKPNADMFDLTDLQWSPDSRFISFVQVFSGYRKICLTNIEIDSYFTPIQDSAGTSFAGRNARWAPNNNLIINPGTKEEDQAGIFVSSVGKIHILDDLSEKIGKNDIDFYEAAISEDGEKTVFTYKNEFSEIASNVLAVSNLDGSEFYDLDKEDIKASPFFSPGGKLVFFTAKSEDRTTTLMSINIETKKRKEVGVLPKDFDVWTNPIWLNGRYLAITGSPDGLVSENGVGKLIFLILDIENKNLLVKKDVGGGFKLIDFL